MSNEITVRLEGSLQEIYSILEQKGFSIVDKFYLNDNYYIEKDIDIRNLPVREILSEYVLIRKITQFEPINFLNSYNILNMTYKKKDIALDGTIIRQEKCNCQIYNQEQGKEFLEKLGYKEIMNIKEKDIVYEKDGLKLAIKDIENGESLIEVETVKDNQKLDTIEKLKAVINELQIPIDTNDYFVKKAEIELKKIL